MKTVRRGQHYDGNRCGRPRVRFAGLSHERRRDESRSSTDRNRGRDTSRYRNVEIFFKVAHYLPASFSIRGRTSETGSAFERHAHSGRKGRRATGLPAGVDAAQFDHGSRGA
jgi:hypothetical protein